MREHTDRPYGPGGLIPTHRLLQVHMEALMEREKRDNSFASLFDVEGAIREGTDVLCHIARTDLRNRAVYDESDIGPKVFEEDRVINLGMATPRTIYHDAMDVVEETRRAYEEWLTRPEVIEALGDPVVVDEPDYIHMKSHNEEMEGLLEANEVSRKHRVPPFEDQDHPEDLHYDLEGLLGLPPMERVDRDSVGFKKDDDTWYTNPRVVLRSFVQEFISKKGSKVKMEYVKHGGQFVCDWAGVFSKADKNALDNVLINLVDRWAWGLCLNQGVSIEYKGEDTKSRIRKVVRNGKTMNMGFCMTDVHKGDNWVTVDSWDKSQYQEQVLADSIWKHRGGMKQAALAMAKEHLAKWPKPIRGKTGNWRCAGCGGHIVDKYVHLVIHMTGWAINGKWVWSAPDHPKVRHWTVVLDVFGKTWRNILARKMTKMSDLKPKGQAKYKRPTKAARLAMRATRRLLEAQDEEMRYKRAQTLVKLDKAIARRPRKKNMQACTCVQCLLCCPIPKAPRNGDIY